MRPRAPLYTYPVSQSSDPFVHLSFHGERFDGAMPLEVLPELAAYRELVVEVARELYRSGNPERQRVPKGFEAGLRLVLDGIGSGSAVPHVVRKISTATPGLFPEAPHVGDADVFERARDVLEAGVRAAISGDNLPVALTPQILVKFNAFGRTLKPKERIDLGAASGGPVVSYTADVRKALLRRANLGYDDSVDLVGQVRSANKDNDGFDLRLADGRRIPVTTPPLFFPVAIQSMSSDAHVRVRGTGRFSPAGELVKVTSASDVSLADEGAEESRGGCVIPVEQQVQSLASLGEHWLDGAGEAYAPESLKWAETLIVGILAAFELPTPYIYPTPEGAFRLEWPRASHEVLAMLDPHTHEADLMSVPLAADEHTEAHFELGLPGRESALGKWLAVHLAEARP